MLEEENTNERNEDSLIGSEDVLLELMMARPSSQESQESQRGDVLLVDSAQEIELGPMENRNGESNKESLVRALDEVFQIKHGVSHSCDDHSQISNNLRPAACYVLPDGIYKTQ